ncbi:DNA polymerase I [Symmachiella dynata]|uniref:DNA polymerase I n=2 Tax=Symmachiella dynata TaxID=2527995 RepID=UPI00118AE156|nr:DNA polymerase I [Symmachiella dynata]QDT48586.1 DNA polymerase I [Symmachiella dynata]
MTSQPRSFYIIDTFSLIFQVFHALPEMTSPQGQPTNAVYGVTRDLITILRDRKPDWLIAAMDVRGENKRNEIYTEYKTNRSAMPEELVPQIPMIEELLAGFGVPALGIPGWEADDVIATLVEMVADQDVEVTVITSDKDIRQLLSPKVRLYNFRKNQYLDEADLMKDWGVTPEQVVDFQALVGDSIDNVPGVPLVGPKKASALIEKFGTLEEILAHADEAPGAKLRENLKTFADQARVSKTLVTLRRDLPLEVDWDAARAGQLQLPVLQEFFQQCGFRRFIDEIKTLAPEAAAPAPPPAVERSWKLIDDADKFSEFLAQLEQQKQFCVDLETTGLDAVRADIVGWAFSWDGAEGFYLPVQAPEGQATLDADEVRDALRPILENPEIEVCNQNIKYDMLVLRRAGIELRGVGVDSMVGSYLLDAGARSHGLDELARRYLQHEMIPISELIGKGKSQIKISEVDVDKVGEYAAEDAQIAWQLAQRITAELKQEDLWDLYWDLERPLISILTDMEFRGIRIDVELLKSLSVEFTERLQTIEAEIYEEAGHEFNIASTKQLAVVLFEELGLPVIKKTKTGASTDQEVLEKLALQHSLPAKLTEFRQLSKLKSTYVDALPEMVNPDTGRIHASFNQVVAATGRLSSSDPNLQNIPIRTEAGRRIRQAFIPGEPGWKLLCADYSQVELRMLAHFSQDPALLAAFERGDDIHTAVAAEVFHVAPEAVDSDMRRIAKAVNFGVIYGQSPYGLAVNLGISQAEASDFIEGYFSRYEGVDKFLRKLLERCSQNGYATTIRGRRREIRGIRSGLGRQRNLPERTAINTVIQGSAADLIKQAMIQTHQRIQQEQHSGVMLLQIHDELVFEVPEADLGSLSDLVREEMESALNLDVPLKVDLSVGNTWLDVEKLD